MRAVVASGLLFAVGHVVLATTVTDLGWPLVVSTAAEGPVCAWVRHGHGVLAATLTHGTVILGLTSVLWTAPGDSGTHRASRITHQDRSRPRHRPGSVCPRGRGGTHRGMCVRPGAGPPARDATTTIGDSLSIVGVWRGGREVSGRAGAGPATGSW